MILKKSLPHQGAFLQAPYLYPEIRFFFDICGYGAGKTSCLADAILYAVLTLSGKRDKEGKFPKIGVCGISLTFLKKTLSGSLVQVLANTKSSYKYNKADNIISVAGVEIFLIPIADEETIFGYDLNCVAQGSLITTKRGLVPIEEVVVGDLVLTRKGFRRVNKTMDKGVREVINLSYEQDDVWLTPDHPVYDPLTDSFIDAKDITNGLTLSPTPTDVKISNEVRQSRVYDLSVEEEHEFFANGLLVHNCIFVDELDELPITTCIGVVKALNDRCRQNIPDCRPPFIAFTTTSQGLKGTYQTVMNFRKAGIGYVIVRGRTRDNIHLLKEYVDSMYAMYNDKERECLLEGKFISIDSGLVFPDYNPAKNFLTGVDYYNNIPEDTTVYIGQDFNLGWNKAVACIVKDRNIVVIKTYSFGDAREAPAVFRYDFPTQKIVWIPDMTYKEHFGDFARELRSYNIRIVRRSSNPNIVSRNFAINKLFFSSRMFLCEFTKELSTALVLHQKDKKTGLPAKGQGEKSPDHMTDALSYVVTYLLGWRRELADVYAVTIGRANKKLKELEEDEEDVV